MWEFGYDANVFYSGEEVGASLVGAPLTGEGLDVIARAMLDGLIGERMWGKDNERPIIFICHSLGGVLIKTVNVLQLIVTADHPFNCQKSINIDASLYSPYPTIDIVICSSLDRPSSSPPTP